CAACIVADARRLSARGEPWSALQNGLPAGQSVLAGTDHPHPRRRSLPAVAQRVTPGALRVMMLQPPLEVMRDIARRALAEDLPWGDVTTENLVPDGTEVIGRFMLKEDAVVSGLNVAALVFEELDASVEFFPAVEDGARAE